MTKEEYLKLQSDLWKKMDFIYDKEIYEDSIDRVCFRMIIDDTALLEKMDEDDLILALSGVDPGRLEAKAHRHKLIEEMKGK